MYASIHILRKLCELKKKLNENTNTFKTHVRTQIFACLPLGHSCDANVTKGNGEKTTTVVRALSTIQPGDEVTVSYGPHYIKDNLAERQAWLKRR